MAESSVAGAQRFLRRIELDDLQWDALLVQEPARKRIACASPLDGNSPPSKVLNAANRASRTHRQPQPCFEVRSREGHILRQALVEGHGADDRIDTACA